jgi:hypothetical protein
VGHGLPESRSTTIIPSRPLASPHCLVCLGPVDSRAVSSIRRALILVVDDEESVRALIADVLVVHGYEVEMATDGDKDSNAPRTQQEERAGVEVCSAR